MNLKKINIPSLLLTLVATGLAVPLIPLGGLYYIFIILIFFVALTKGKINFNPSLIFFVVWSILGLFVNKPNPFFHSWERLISFVLVASVLSPLLKNEYLKTIRCYTFSYTLIATVIISVGSFGAYLLGINYMTMATSAGAGSFGGLTSQSMLLAPISGISMCFLLWRILTIEMGKYEKLFHIACAFLSFVMVLIASSRGAFLASLAGCVIIIYRLYRKNISKLFTVFFIVVVFGIVLFPVIRPYANNLIVKQQNNITAGGTIASRGSKWENRLEEFKSNPLFGVGFVAVSDENIEDDAGAGGVVESGSSWLAFLSMTGLMGFLLFTYFYFKSLFRLFSMENSRLVFLFEGLLCFFAVHLLVEGYAMYAGSYLFYLLWLLLGVSNLIQPEGNDSLSLIEKNYLRH